MSVLQELSRVLFGFFPNLLFHPFLFDCHCIVVIVVLGFTFRTDTHLVILAVNLNVVKEYIINNCFLD